MQNHSLLFLWIWFLKHPSSNLYLRHPPLYPYKIKLLAFKFIGCNKPSCRLFTIRVFNGIVKKNVTHGKYDNKRRKPSHDFLHSLYVDILPYFSSNHLYILIFQHLPYYIFRFQQKI